MNQQLSPKVEIINIAINQLVSVVCVWFFGWKFAEILLLFAVEILAGFLLWCYVIWYLERAFRESKLKKKAANKSLLFRISGTIVSLFLLTLLIISNLKTEFLQCLNWELALFLIVFLLLMFVPIWIWQNRGFIVTKELLPVQSRILLTFEHLFTTTLICFLGIIFHLFQIELLYNVLIICGLKFAAELWIYNKIKNIS